MATINYAFKEISCKIVYYGPGLCGKTTNLQYVHGNVPPKFRGELISLATEQDRTLFFDFLPLDLGEVKGFKTKFQLYTVPGQVYYNATRKLVLRGVDGIVFVVDSQRERIEENIDSFKNLKDNIKEYGYDLKNIPLVFQYNKRDLPNVSSVEELEKIINVDKLPYFEGVATTGIGVKETLKAISSLVLKKLSAEPSEPYDTKPESPRPAAIQPTPFSEQEIKAKENVQAPKQEFKRPLSEPVAKQTSNIQSVAEPIKPKQPEKIITQKPPEDLTPKVSPPLVSKKILEAKQVKEKEQHVINVSIKQQCHMLWRSIKIGTGTIEFTNRTNVDYKGDYQITGIFRALAFKRSFWTKLPKYIGKEVKKIDGEKKDFYHFFIELDQKDINKKIVDIYLDAKDPDFIYVEYPGFLGKISIVPLNKKPLV